MALGRVFNDLQLLFIAATSKRLSGHYW